MLENESPSLSLGTEVLMRNITETKGFQTVKHVALDVEAAVSGGLIVWGLVGETPVAYIGGIVGIFLVVPGLLISLNHDTKNMMDELWRRKKFYTQTAFYKKGNEKHDDAG